MVFARINRAYYFSDKSFPSPQLRFPRQRFFVMRKWDNVGDTKLKFSTIELFSKQLSSQKQLKSNWGNMLCCRGFMNASRTWGQGAEGHIIGPGVGAWINLIAFIGR